MFVNVRNDHEIELTAVGRTDIELLEKLSKGVHVQAYDKSRGYVTFLIITPELLPEKADSAALQQKQG